MTISPFPTARLAEAEAAYAEAEKAAQEGAPIDAVLIAAGPIEKMKRAYPNYFADTQGFIGRVRRFIEDGERPTPAKKAAKRSA